MRARGGLLRRRRAVAAWRAVCDAERTLSHAGGAVSTRTTSLQVEARVALLYLCPRTSSNADTALVCTGPEWSNTHQC